MKTAKYWIKHLEMQPHPEGGYYKETFRSKHDVEVSHIDNTITEKRSLSTSIYFLIEQGNFSQFHVLKADEIWHFYSGDPLIIHMIDQDGNYSYQVLGKELDKGQKLKFIVPAGVWFASEVYENGKYSLVGCTVTFGFDFKDFVMADKSLIDKFPQHKDILDRLIR